MASDTNTSTVRAWNGDEYRTLAGGHPNEVRTAGRYAIDFDTYDMPGWEVVGVGSTRTLLRSPKGRYYKVANCPDGATATAREVHSWANLAAAGWTVPAHTLYRAPVPVYPGVTEDVMILEVEYIEADGTEADVNAALDALADLRIVDLNPSNIVVRGGQAVIIDAGGVG